MNRESRSRTVQYSQSFYITRSSSWRLVRFSNSYTPVPPVLPLLLLLLLSVFLVGAILHVPTVNDDWIDEEGEGHGEMVRAETNKRRARAERTICCCRVRASASVTHPPIHQEQDEETNGYHRFARRFVENDFPH